MHFSFAYRVCIINKLFQHRNHAFHLHTKKYLFSIAIANICSCPQKLRHQSTSGFTRPAAAAAAIILSAAFRRVDLLGCATCRDRGRELLSQFRAGLRRQSAGVPSVGVVCSTMRAMPALSTEVIGV